MGKQDQRMILILTCKCHRLNLLKAAEVPEKIFVLPIKWPYYQKFHPCPAALRFSRTRCSSSGLSSQTASAGPASHWTWAADGCWVKPSLRSQCQMFPPGGVGGVLLHDVGHTELEQALPHDVHWGLTIHGELRPEWWYSYWSKSWRFSKPTSLSNSAWRCSLPGQPDIPQLWYWCNAIIWWHFDNLFTLFSVQFWMASPKL